MSIAPYITVRAASRGVVCNIVREPGDVFPCPADCVSLQSEGGWMVPASDDAATSLGLYRASSDASAAAQKAAANAANPLQTLHAPLMPSAGPGGPAQWGPRS